MEDAERVYLFGVDTNQSPHWSIHDSLQELERLAATAGLTVAGRDFQKRDAVHPATYMGSGKLDLVREEMTSLEARTLILDDELSPGQQRNIEKQWPDDFKVIDRTALILDIFAQHARTREGQLQVELAQYRYRLPRLTRMWTHLVRQSGTRAGGVRGGVGLRGPGETQIESDRRLIRNKIAALRQELDEVRAHRQLYRRNRRRKGIPVVSLVGYTNAGKSTLLRRLSHADIKVADELFSTLDPTTRRVSLPGGREVLFTDTVGFINKLPHDLIAAFRATLEEIHESDLIVHIVDISHPKAEAQSSTVEKTLGEMGIVDKPLMTVWNKIDVPGAEWYRSDHAIRISARSGEGITDLLSNVETKLKESLISVEIWVPYSRMDLLAGLHRRGVVEEVDHREQGACIRALMSPGVEAHMKRNGCRSCRILKV